MKFFVPWVVFCIILWFVACILAANLLWFWWMFVIPIEITLLVMAAIALKPICGKRRPKK